MATKVKANLNDDSMSWQYTPAEMPLWDEEPPSREPEPSTKKPRVKRRRLYEPFTLIAMLTDEQEKLLIKWMRIAWDLRSKGIHYKEDHDRDRYPPNLLESSQLIGLLPEWKKEHPKFAELPAEAAQQILHDCVRDVIKFRKRRGKDRNLLRAPVRSLRMVYARFITAEATSDTLLVNTRAISLPKLGSVKFTGNKKLLAWIRTTDIRIRGVQVWPHEDGKWRIRIFKYRTTKELMTETKPDPYDVLRATRDIFIAAARKDGSDANYIKSGVIRKELAEQGFKLSAVELAERLRSLGVTVKRREFKGKDGSWYSSDEVIEAYMRERDERCDF